MSRRVLRIVVEIRDTDLDTIFKDIVDDILADFEEAIDDKLYRRIRRDLMKTLQKYKEPIIKAFNDAVIRAVMDGLEAELYMAVYEKVRNEVYRILRKHGIVV